MVHTHTTCLISHYRTKLSTPCQDIFDLLLGCWAELMRMHSRCWWYRHETAPDKSWHSDQLKAGTYRSRSSGFLVCHRLQIDAAFQQLRHVVVLVALGGPMVVMSGQHYISRVPCLANSLQSILGLIWMEVSFLFSIFDMDGDGCLNESEIILAATPLEFFACVFLHRSCGHPRLRFCSFVRAAGSFGVLRRYPRPFLWCLRTPARKLVCCSA